MKVEENIITNKRIGNYDELVDFSHSEITEEVINNLNIIADNFNRELNYYASNCKMPQLKDENKS